MIKFAKVQASEALTYSQVLKAAIHDVPHFPKKAAQQEGSNYVPSKVRRRTKEQNLIQVVAKEGKLIVGAGYGICYAGVCYLEWIGIQRTHRGKGIGKKLVRYLEQAAKRQGIHKVWLNTDNHNLASIKLFRSAGYRKIGVVKKHWYGTDNILWEKQIAKPKSYAR